MAGKAFLVDQLGQIQPLSGCEESVEGAGGVTMSKPHEEVIIGIALTRDHLAEKGLGKNQTNTHQNFKFRGIDDLYGILEPALTHGKIILSPSLVSIERKEYTTANGKVQFSTVVVVDYIFEAIHDGSTRTYRYAGESADTGDKSLSKALTMAFKSFCFHVFQIPLNGNDDADKHTAEEVEAPKLDADSKADLEAVAAEGLQAFRDAWKKLSKETKVLAQNDKEWFASLKKTAEQNAQSGA